MSSETEFKDLSDLWPLPPLDRFRMLSRALTNWSLWKALGWLFILISVYVGILAVAPPLLSTDFLTPLLADSWWALDFLVVFGSGGGFLTPGVASVGLLGSLLFFRKKYRYLRNSMAPWRAVTQVINLVSTAIISVIVLIAYAGYADASWLHLAAVGVAAFGGSVLLQFIDAEFFRRTGASLFAVNVVLGFVRLLHHFPLSASTARWMTGALVVVGLGALVVSLQSRTVAMRMGTPPRTDVRESLPYVDVPLLQGLSLTMLITAAAASAVWDVFALTSPVWVQIGLGTALVVAAGVLFYVLNRRAEMVCAFDPPQIVRIMNREHATIVPASGVLDGDSREYLRPDSSSVRYLRMLLSKAQRWTLAIFALVVATVGIASVLDLQISGRPSLILGLAAPFVVGVFLHNARPLLNTIQNWYDRASQTVDIPLRTFSSHSGGGLFGRDQPLDEEEAIRKADELLDIILDLRNYPEEERKRIREDLYRILNESETLLNGIRRLDFNAIRRVIQRIIWLLPRISQQSEPTTLEEAKGRLRQYWTDDLKAGLFSAILQVIVLFFPLAIILRAFGVGVGWGPFIVSVVPALLGGNILFSPFYRDPGLRTALWIVVKNKLNRWRSS